MEFEPLQLAEQPKQLAEQSKQLAKQPFALWERAHH